MTAGCDLFSADCLADLVILSLGLSSSDSFFVQDGEAFVLAQTDVTITTVEGNEGEEGAESHTYQTLGRFRPSTGSAVDLGVLSSREVTELPAGQSDQSQTIESFADVGTVLIEAVADVFDNVCESLEDNNESANESGVAASLTLHVVNSSLDVPTAAVPVNSFVVPGLVR